MAEKFTNRMGYTAVIGGNITPEVIAWAQAELAKINAKNEKRKSEGIKEENKEVADAILVALANGQMLAVDLAVAIGQSVPKTNGVAGEMVKLGMLTKSKVKVKGKGDMTAYALPPTEDTEDTAPTEGATEG
jgi:hypothetical protein